MADSATVEIHWKEFAGDVASKAIAKLDGIQAAATKTAQATASMGATADKALGFFKGAGIAAAITVAATELAKFHAETRKFTASLGDQADSVRQTTDQYQAWVSVQDRIGNSQDKTTASLSALNGKVDEAAGGGRKAIEAFQALGVKLLDANGQVRSLAALTGETAQSILRMADADQRAALAKQMFNVSGRDADAALRQFALGIDEATRQAKNAGHIIGGEAVDAARELEKQSKSTQIAIRAFYAQIGMPIEHQFLRETQSIVEKITSAYRAASEAKKRFDEIGTHAVQMDELRKLDSRIAAAENNLANPGMIERLTRTPGSRAAVERDIADMKAQREKLAGEIGRDAINRRVGSPDVPPVVTRSDFGGNKDPTVTGSGGGSGRDRIGENLRMVTAQAQAAAQAFDRMRAGQGMALQDLEQQVKLEKDIADELAKLGKYDANDPRLAALREQVIQREKSESALRKYVQAARDAEAIEKQMGDGTAFLRAEMSRLNDALDTGRLSYETYAVAVKQARERAEEMRLTQASQQAGIEGFIGGWQLAAYQANRASQAGQLGARAYADSFNLMKGAVDEWAQTGVFNFNKVAQGFANMLSNMAWAWAQSELSKAMGIGVAGAGGGGGLFSGIQNLLNIGNWGGVTSTAIGGPDGFGGLGGIVPGFFADGGDPPVGRPSIVGERGPEWFVPKTAGTVLNQQQMAALGVGGRPRALDVRVSLDNDMLRATVRDESGRQIAAATPQILSRSQQLVPSTMARYHAEREGSDYRID